jgi:hypothetical protein
MFLGTATAYGSHTAFIAVPLVFVSFWLELGPGRTPDGQNIRAKSYAFATRVLPLGTLTINTIDRDVCHPWLG